MAQGTDPHHFRCSVLTRHNVSCRKADPLEENAELRQRENRKERDATLSCSECKGKDAIPVLNSETTRAVLTLTKRDAFNVCNKIRKWVENRSFAILKLDLKIMIKNYLFIVGMPIRLKNVLLRIARETSTLISIFSDLHKYAVP